MALYFAYGSNMSQCDLDEWCGKHDCARILLRDKSPQKAVLKDYDLRFHYKSTTRKGGAADVLSCEGKAVEGMLFELSDEEMELIDGKEGVTYQCYERRIVTVTLFDGTSVEGATTYTVVPSKRRVDDYEPPRHRYLNIMLTAAEDWGLSKTWIEHLRSFTTAEETIQCV